jgi:hypothetical protein
MRSRSVRAGLTALTLAVPVLIVAASEPGAAGLSWWRAGGAGRLGAVELALLAGMALAGRARRWLAPAPAPAPTPAAPAPTPARVATAAS